MLKTNIYHVEISGASENFSAHEKKLSHFKLLCRRNYLKGTQSALTALTWTLVFSHFEKSLPQPEIEVDLEIRSIFRSVLLDFQSFTEESVLRVLLLIL